MNFYGKNFRFISFGESHSACIGVVIDGILPNIRLNLDEIQEALNLRKGGSKFTTPRVEEDKLEILSGIFNGLSTGAPIAFIVKNKNQRSSDYENLKDTFRPNHSDFTYEMKFGIRDYRGGGRSSGRESIARVIAGDVARQILNKISNIKVQSSIFSIGKIKNNLEISKCDFNYANISEIGCGYKNLEESFKNEILKARKKGDSVGGVVITKISNVLVGLGEVLYDKLDARLASAIIGIGGVKGIEFGEGIKMSSSFGSEVNDEMEFSDGRIKFLSNNSGGIQGGISNGEDIIIKSFFKPTPSISLEQKTIRKTKNGFINSNLQIKGRHDPCIAIRGLRVINAMIYLTLLDFMMNKGIYEIKR